MGQLTQDVLQAKGLTEIALVNAAERRGIDIGLCLAASLLARDFDNPTYAAEILGSGGIDAERISDLDLDEYDVEPLLRVLAES